MKNESKYVIFGIGQYGKLVYERLWTDINIVNFSDNNQNFWNKEICCGDGTQPLICVSPDDIPQDAEVIVATASIYRNEIAEQLSKLGLKFVYGDKFVLEYYKEKTDYVETQCLTSDSSRELYRRIVECRKSGDEMAKLYSPDQYFAIPEFCKIRTDEVFVDAGAFCGDIVDTYVSRRLGLFGKIYAFEPGRRQYAAMQIRTERLRKEWALDDEQIICINAAVGEKNGFCSFTTVEDNIATSRINMLANENENSIPIYQLDKYIDGKADFIKADVEGSELALLKGSKNIIKEYRPKLAVCLYHTPFDLFEIPEYIKKLVPEYHMEVKHHSYDTGETVLYAYI